MGKNLKLILIVIFALIIIFAFMIFNFTSDKKIDSNHNVNDVVGGNEIGYDDVEEIEEFEDEEIDEIGEDFGGGTGSGGGGSSGGIFGGGCIEQQIPYALKNFEEFEVCNIYQEGKCINKDVICSLVVENLDYEISGNFEIEFNFFDESGNKFDSIIGDIFLNFRTEKKIEKILNVLGENAGQSYDCISITSKVPAKKEC